MATLDPQARALLDQMAAMGGAPLSSMPVEGARQLMNALASMQGAGEAVAHVEDIRIPGPGGDIPARLYRPAGDALPLLVYFHGGGWVIGSLESHDALCRTLANAAGCAVLSIDYRLAPEHRYPAAADDCYAATVWAVANARALGTDPARVAIGGDSAGGNLTAVTALRACDQGTPALRFQLLVYPVTDHRYDTASYRENAEGYLLSRTDMVWFWDHYLGTNDGTEPYASPLRATNLAGLPPALVITAGFDPLRDEGEAYAERLKKAGIPVTLTRYDGMIHGFFGMGAQLDEAKRAIGQAATALRAAL
ncbi:MAG TPA: alpha/beta hydrolase [Candidatus Binatia bacterium]|nr:alpha/beta hydrolase [Candidatus Binatia bacterium]